MAHGQKLLLFLLRLALAATSGILLMSFYYLAQLHFPYAGRDTTSLLVDQHVIYSVCLLLVWKFNSGDFWGLQDKVKRVIPLAFKRLV